MDYSKKAISKGKVTDLVTGKVYYLKGAIAHEKIGIVGGNGLFLAIEESKDGPDKCSIQMATTTIKESDGWGVCHCDIIATLTDYIYEEEE